MPFFGVGAKTIVKLVNPKIGEIIYDGACGSCGFLVETFNYIKESKSLTVSELKKLQSKTLYGKEKKNLAEEVSIVKQQSKARSIKGRRGRPIQRKRYVRRGSIDQRKKLKDIKTEPININASGSEAPASQSSKVAETYQTRVDVDDPQKPSPQNASISQPNIEPRVNTNVAIPLPVDPTLKPNRKNKDFFKRVADLFSKHGEVEKPPPPGTEP